MLKNFLKFYILLFFLLSELILFSQNKIKKDSLLGIVNMYGNDTTAVHALVSLSEIFLYQNSDSALFYCKKASDISEKFSFDKGKAESYRNLGRINTISGHYEEALDYFYEALKVNDKLFDTLSMGNNFASIGIVHYYQHDLDKAMEFFKKAAEIFKTKNVLKELGRVFNNMGLVYSDYNNLDTAQYYFDKTIENAKRIGDTKIEISALGNLARIFLIKKEFGKAVQKFQKLIKKTDTVNDKSTICITYANICSAYLNMIPRNKNINYSDSALKYNILAMKYADELNSNTFRLYAYDNFAEIYKKKHEYKKAFENLEKYTTLNDSIFNQEKTKAIANIEAKYENEKKQLIIENLQKEKQADAIIIQKKNTIILIIIIGFLIVFVLLLFLFNLYRSKNQALILLDVKNKDILKQREEIAAQRDKLSEIAFELKKTNRTKNKLFSIIAHDLKNPFQGIIGFSEMIKNEAADYKADKIEKYSEYIYDVSNQTFKLLENLLDFTRSQMGLIKYNPENININSVINDSITLLGSNADEKGVTLINETDKTLTAFADETMISTVIRNLISNAVKFTQKGGFVKIKEEKENNFVVIKIIDNGVGIKKSDIPKLFKADLNFSTFGTQKEKGTGLGLVVCKDFVVKNKGTISVESEEGKGSTFTIKLPVNK